VIDALYFHVQARGSALQVSVLGAIFGIRWLRLQAQCGRPEACTFVSGRVLAVDDESGQTALVRHDVLRRLGMEEG